MGAGKYRLRVMLALLLLALASLVIALATGSTPINITQIPGLLFSPGDNLQGSILHDLRLPRAMTAFAVGGLLALSGALIQVLLKNPLGDPYVLGISGGAAVAVLGAMLLGLPSNWQTPLGMMGALTSMVLVLGMANPGSQDSGKLLLTGVLVASGWSALISFVLSLSPPVQLPGMLFWLMGDLGGSHSPALVLMLLAVGLMLALWLAPELNLLAQGELRARTLGVEVNRLRLWVYLLSALMTAGAVVLAGTIGFVGLIAPHLARLLIGNDQRLLLPSAVLIGSSLLTLADTAARTLISPMQLPVGVLTAMLGVPFFLMLLNLRKGR